MEQQARWPRICGALVAAAVIVALGAPAAALDGHQDRRGLFSGIGLGGGAALQDGQTGGEMLLELQLGGGITKRLTLALDIDVWFQLMDDHQNWMVVPGPELSIFIIGGFFVRAGVGLAFVFVKQDADVEVMTPGKDPEANDFALAFDGSVGLGYEFFVGSNLALGLAIDGDYFAIGDEEDVIGLSLSFGIRYY